MFADPERCDAHITGDPSGHLVGHRRTVGMEERAAGQDVVFESQHRRTVRRVHQILEHGDRLERGHQHRDDRNSRIGEGEEPVERPDRRGDQVQWLLVVDPQRLTLESGGVAQVPRQRVVPESQVIGRRNGDAVHPDPTFLRHTRGTTVGRDDVDLVAPGRPTPPRCRWPAGRCHRVRCGGYSEERRPSRSGQTSSGSLRANRRKIIQPRASETKDTPVSASIVRHPGAAAS